MKKVLSLILALCLVLSIGAFATDNERVTVYVGGEKIEADVTAKIVSDRTMLPLRAVFEALGAKVSYEETTETVTAEKGDTVVKLVIGSDIMTVNGEEKKLDVAAYTENGRTMVPVRACAEAFDLQVDWFDPVNIVRIRKETSVISDLKASNGITATYQYDENGNEIFIENSRGYWKKSTYDENECLVSWEDVNGEYTKYEYNSFGDVIREEIRDEIGDVFAYLYEYDANGNNTYMTLEGSPDIWAKYVYDEKNNLTYLEMYDGSWKKFYYDSANNLISTEQDNGSWSKLTYDENGNNIRYEDSTGTTMERTYDENGNMTYEKDSSGVWFEYAYDDNGNMKLAVDNSYNLYNYKVVTK